MVEVVSVPSYCCCCCFVSVWMEESAASCVCVFFLSPAMAAVGGEGVRAESRCMGLFSRLPAEGTVNVLPKGVCAIGVG